jgi:ribonucleotide monophosphatase NagD (HAD superfamily)
MFDDEEEAAAAYDNYARMYFTNPDLNFPDRRKGSVKVCTM